MRECSVRRARGAAGGSQPVACPTFLALACPAAPRLQPTLTDAASSSGCPCPRPRLARPEDHFHQLAPKAPPGTRALHAGVQRVQACSAPRAARYRCSDRSDPRSTRARTTHHSHRSHACRRTLPVAGRTPRRWAGGDVGQLSPASPASGQRPLVSWPGAAWCALHAVRIVWPAPPSMPIRQGAGHAVRPGRRSSAPRNAWCALIAVLASIATSRRSCRLAGLSAVVPLHVPSGPRTVRTAGGRR